MKEKIRKGKKKKKKMFPVFTINLAVIKFMKADRPENI